ncbi:MAG TPA: ADP-ribosylglycohydrolase family protein [Casimicrobiaceae bacterium]
MDEPTNSRRDPPPALKRRYRGCLLGGAIGDALGAPVEFMSLTEIRETFGRAGITEFTTAFNRKGAITDDTQMTLFTAEGLLRAYVAGAARGELAAVAPFVANAYARWLATQDMTPGVADFDRDGWLFAVRELFEQRVPGASCLAALEQMTRLGERTQNDSKGCGGVMRSAPVGLWCARLDDGLSSERIARRALELGSELAGLTNGHPTGRLSAGAFAAIVALLVQEVTLPAAVASVKALLARHPGHAETLHAIERAEAVAATGIPRAEALVELGEGWTAEEALAIALASALAAPDFETGVRLAVNHDGDSDSTAAIAGNLLGALHGVEGIPKRWLLGLELRRVVLETADDLATFPDWPIGEFMPDSHESMYWKRRYPGT